MGSSLVRVVLLPLTVGVRDRTTVKLVLDIGANSIKPSEYHTIKYIVSISDGDNDDSVAIIKSSFILIIIINLILLLVLIIL